MHDDYSVRQLAECTGLSDRTIRNYLASGILEGEKTEGGWRFTPEQVEELDRKSTRLNSSHQGASRMPSSA